VSKIIREIAALFQLFGHIGGVGEEGGGDFSMTPVASPIYFATAPKMGDGLEHDKRTC